MFREIVNVIALDLSLFKKEINNLYCLQERKYIKTESNSQANATLVEINGPENWSQNHFLIFFTVLIFIIKK